MAGNLTFDELKKAVGGRRDRHGRRCFPDMQGRLIGKRFQAEYLPRRRLRGDAWLRLSAGQRHRYGAGAGLRRRQLGEGLRRLRHEARPGDAAAHSVAAGTALVLCDILDHHSHEALAHAPARHAAASRSRGSTRSACRPISPRSSNSICSTRPTSLREAKGYRDLKTAGSYIQDYHIFQTTKEEEVMRAIRNGLQAAGIPVENSKGEWGPGQEEINVRYAEALEMADRHVILKNGCKEIAYGLGKAVTFMAKWRLRPRRLVEPHPRLAVGCRRQEAALPRCRRPSTACRRLMRQYVAGPARLCAGDHLVPRALHQFLQALPGRHLRADQGDLVAATTAPPASASAAQSTQGHPHRVPHRRRRSQSLSRLRRADRRRPCRHRAEAGAGAALRRRRLSTARRCARCRRRCARRPS